MISNPVYGLNERPHFCMLQEDEIFGSWPKIFGRYSFKLHPYGSVIQPVTKFVKHSFVKL